MSKLNSFYDTVFIIYKLRKTILNKTSDYRPKILIIDFLFCFLLTLVANRGFGNTKVCGIYARCSNKIKKKVKYRVF